MTAIPRSPKTLAGGFILMDADGKAVLRTVAFQYNPDTLTRSLAPRAAKVESGDRVEALRLVGPPVETLKLEIELDAADRLEHPQRNPETVSDGIAPELADLETIVTPRADDLDAANRLAASGTLEVLPLPSPLVLLVLGRNRALPVRITDLSVVEEAFDPQLNPIRARVSIGLRILSIDDLSYGTKGAELFMTALRRRERLAARKPANVQSLGLDRAP
ncbi:hypothetical protein BTH42_32140 [Burkholderia sp. SRS-W-2-2016]|uniref:hypothetical protein n=1 Tax=Burkholderia sp. SRS-W-2-2016 TaxID=1926878 RepID=UPI00094A9E1D|nr:hypothetical protein [Burkholderia sp. SRS-W-2-2016]OLL27496.1 hypothetical protein BTH42_32140 [Burkholderia sp. SRS-W-2-2016]